MEYTIVSSLLHVVCISMFLELCSKSLQSTDLGIQKKQQHLCVSVWLLVCSSEVAVPSHYAHMPLKTDTRQKIRGDRSCTHVPTWRKHWGTLTDARTDHTPSQYIVFTITPIVVTNQIKKCIQLFYLHYRLLPNWHMTVHKLRTKP